jgi:hypothetical protein
MPRGPQSHCASVSVAECERRVVDDQVSIQRSRSQVVRLGVFEPAKPIRSTGAHQGSSKSRSRRFGRLCTADRRRDQGPVAVVLARDLQHPQNQCRTRTRLSCPTSEALPTACKICVLSMNTNKKSPPTPDCSATDTARARLVRRRQRRQPEPNAHPERRARRRMVCSHRSSVAVVFAGKCVLRELARDFAARCARVESSG